MTLHGECTLGLGEEWETVSLKTSLHICYMHLTSCEPCLTDGGCPQVPRCPLGNMDHKSPLEGSFTYFKYPTYDVEEEVVMFSHYNNTEMEA